MKLRDVWAGALIGLMAGGNLAAQQVRFVGPLRVRDLSPIAALRLEGDVFFFDGEVSIIDVDYIGSISNRMQVEVTWPVVLRGGGFLDRFIDSFHDTVGLNTANRYLTSRNDSPAVTVAWERRLNDRNWTILQGSWSRSTLKGAAASALTDDRTQVTIGWRHLVSRNVVASAAMTENVIRFKNTPDFGIHFALGWIIPSRTHLIPQ